MVQSGLESDYEESHRQQRKVIPAAVLDEVIEAVGNLGGSGGVIALGPDGTPHWSYDTPGMYRGYATPQKRVVAIYKDEE